MSTTRKAITITPITQLCLWSDKGKTPLLRETTLLSWTHLLLQKRQDVDEGVGLLFCQLSSQTEAAAPVLYKDPQGTHVVDFTGSTKQPVSGNVITKYGNRNNYGFGVLIMKN